MIDSLNREGPPNMSTKKRSFNTPAISRTIFDDVENRTPIQDCIVDENHLRYSQTHRSLLEADEMKLLKDSVPKECLFCHSKNIIKWGKTKNEIVRYRCNDCYKTFTPKIGNLFDYHKISIAKWIEYIADLKDYMSLQEISKTMRISMTTAKYWLIKVFYALQDYQDDILLSGDIIIDEYYLPVSISDLSLTSDGKKKRGKSTNQICICTGTDKSGKVLAIVSGLGWPSKKEIWDSYGSHIKPFSKLIHDKEKEHSILVERLDLKNRGLLRN